MPALVGNVRCNQEISWKTNLLNSSKEVIAFLAELLPQCFSAEGEARPESRYLSGSGRALRGDEPQQNAALFCLAPLYLELARYLYGIKLVRPVSTLTATPCGELDEHNVEHARKQL